MKTSIPPSITVVAVSKNQPLAKIIEVINAGFTHFGENRVEEIERKWVKLTLEKRSKITLHMIGHVQSRKAAKVVALCDWIDSVDGLKLAQKLDAQAKKLHKRLKILVQVNVAGETHKSGYKIGRQLEQELLEINDLKNLTLRGLMTIAPLVDDSEETRPVFKQLAELRNSLRAKYPQLNLEHLSMGMTNDYRVAIEEGATMVRIGRGIFGGL